MSVFRPSSIIALVRDVLADRALRRKAISFASIGVVNTLVDYSLFSFIHLYVGVPIIPANVCSWLVAVTGSYVMNTMITFAAESERRLRLKTYGMFLAAQSSGLVGNTTTVFVGSYFMPVLIAKALAVGVSFVIDFTLSNFVVFRSQGSVIRDQGSEQEAQQIQASSSDR
jgi:putative flippase GtrA